MNYTKVLLLLLAKRKSFTLQIQIDIGPSEKKRGKKTASSADGKTHKTWGVERRQTFVSLTTTNFFSSLSDFCLALLESISVDWHAAVSVSVLFGIFFSTFVSLIANTTLPALKICSCQFFRCCWCKHIYPKTQKNETKDWAWYSKWVPVVFYDSTSFRKRKRKRNRKNYYVKLRPVNICHSDGALWFCAINIFSSRLICLTVDPLTEFVDFLLRDTNYDTCEIAQTHLFFALKCCSFLFVCVSGCVSVSRTDHAYLNTRLWDHIFHSIFSIADMHFGAAITVGIHEFFHICRIFRPSPSFDHNSFILISIFYKGPIPMRLRKRGGHWLWFHWASNYILFGINRVVWQ